ncbi:MAG: DUF2845 domain-containing protein [Gammaproteobacteria bacterium]|nr:DUF2845 domain-containing protein [Gammaproteobacteria bacterium]
MAIKLFLSVLMLVAFTFVQVQAASNSMRCGTRIISKGDTKVEILLKCGEPMLKETIAIREHSKEVQLKSVADFMANKNNHSINHAAENTASKSPRHQFGQINLESSVALPIDRWTYNLGKGRFLRILIFEGGTLVNIAAGDRS